MTYVIFLVTYVTEKVTNDTLSALAVDDIIIAEEKHKFANKRREAMLFIVITLVILGIWILFACIDNSESAPGDRREGRAGKIIKALLIILLIALIIGIIGFIKAMNELGAMFDSCCETAEKIGRMG